MMSAQDVLAYWLDELKPKDWYAGGDAFDADIRKRFLDVWERAHSGSLGLWLTCPSEALAYIIVTDQMSRNIHRGSADAFVLDDVARAAAKMAINKGWDMKIDEPARQFFYMPLMHSENQIDQDRAVRLIHDRMPETGARMIDHARAHREIIRKFGRFPYRNAALARAHTPAENAFIAGGGYGGILRQIQSEETVAA